MAKAKYNNDDEPRLFEEKLVPAEPGSGLLFQTEYESNWGGTVECLGVTFPNDEERRKHFLGILREKLKDPEFRKIEGFPIGSDADILALSDPPYYTACPNPFITDFVEKYGTPYDPNKPYSREPFAADVSEGKNDPIYNAHSYHTKVPHKAIMRYILHYTEPGDIVFDGFCGTGMTGVAAQMCGDRAEVTALGYRVDEDGTISQHESDENGKTIWKPFSKLGARRAVLNDLSPAATFIAYNYNTPVDVHAFEREAKRILKEVEDECGWMYETYHVEQASSLSIDKIFATAAENGWKPIDHAEVARKQRDLPHWNYEGAILFVTFRTYDSLVLSAEARDAVLEAVKFYHGGKINLYSAVVMPDHVHMLFQLREGDLSSLMHSIKSYSANQVNKIMGRSGILWQNESYDRIIRDGKEFFNTINYIYRNPEKAVEQASNLCNNTDDAGWKPDPRSARRHEKTPDENDLALIEKIENSDIPYWFPADRMMEGGETRRNDPIGITHVHHFYTKRNLLTLSTLRGKVKESRIKALHYWLNSLDHGLGKRVKHGNYSFPMSTLSGTLYIPSLGRENNPLHFYATRLKKQSLVLAGSSAQGNPVSTQSSEGLNVLQNSFDYIFIDPPFGSNLNYSELSFPWESWLKVWTNNKPEAIENRVQQKGLNEYRQLMTTCFRETYRVLKPGRWLTVEFSNTQASVWNSIQAALTEAGFIIANVSVLDKQQGSFKAVTTPTAVKQDLVISAYKPNGGFEERFVEQASSLQPDAIWDFVRTHMKYLPIVNHEAGTTQLIPVEERDPRILYDQMITYYVRKGFPVPLNSADFQEGLSQRFSYRDGMYFLPDQVAEYDKRRLASGGLKQATLFVSDESSAISWLSYLLKDKPQTFQDIHPLFIKELAGWQKYEKPLELSELLGQNFIRYDGAGLVPEQIHAYLSTNWKDLRNLPKDDPTLRAKAQDRWYVPDPNKAGDLEKLRERSLLKEFQEYVALASSQRKLKVFRLEAVRAGFKKAWQERDYETIIAVAQKIPENVLQEDPKLLMWYDQAMTRKGEE